MNEQALLERIRHLPPDKQEAVEHFLEEIEHENVVNEPRRSLMGALAHLDLHVTEDDIDEVRREMWGNFPRNDI